MIGADLRRVIAKRIWSRTAALSVSGAFIQTLTMVDVATGWTECFPLVLREAALVVETIGRAQSLFPWPIRGLDFDNDSAFMNDVIVHWCRSRGIEVNGVESL
jgi:hypothetical protein